jgi:adenosine kinase
MSEARQIELGPLHRQAPLDLVLISPNDPQAMIRHTQECRQRGLPFAADPSQQLAWSDGAMVRELVDGATYLFSNDYESALIHSKTGWDAEQVRERVQVRVTTHGKDGVVVETRDGERIEVPVVPAVEVIDPTGVGDAFRAGFLAGVSEGLPLERCAQVGCLLATHVIETMGPQEYQLHRGQALARFAESYGALPAEQIAPLLAHLPG